MLRRSYYIILVIALLFAAIPIGTAFAGSTSYKDFTCKIAPSTIPGGLVTTDSHGVVTPSGSSVIVCHFHGSIEGAFEAMKYLGFRCNMPNGATYKSRINVTPSGEVILTCHINGSAPAITTSTNRQVTTASDTSITDGYDGSSPTTDPAPAGGDTPPSTDGGVTPSTDAPTPTDPGAAPAPSDTPPSDDAPSSDPPPSDSVCDGNNGYHGGECDKPGKDK